VKNLITPSMKKLLIPLLTILIAFSACTIEIDLRDKDPDEEAPVVEGDLALRLDEVLLINNSTYNQDFDFKFSLYLERPDLMLKQPESDDLYTSDLPIELQPKLIYVSELNDTVPDSGRLCDRPIFPHRCEMFLEPGFEETEKTYLVKVTFEDNTYASSEITVPIPEPLNPPTIKFPEEMPEQEAKFEMKFEDIGADRYDITVSLCHEYENDGINPCLDGGDYTVELIEDELVVTFDNSLYPLDIKVRDGLIVASSNIPLNFTESVEYAIQAHKEFVLDDGTKAYIESSDLVTF